MTIEPTSQARPQAKAPVALSRPLGDIDQAWRMASALAQSSLMPDALRGKASNVLVILMYGQELGLSPMQAIQGIYVVNGRPQMSGQLWITKVRDAGHRHFVACKECDAPPERHRLHAEHRYIADHDATRCTVTIVRSDTGERHTETFTWEDAERANLVKKDVWRSWPKRMLLWRAVSSCATIICPEVAMGFGAEMPADDSPEPEVALAQAVDARQDDAQPASGHVDVQDADIVDEPESENLTAADEQARQEVMNLAAEYEQPEQPTEPNVPADYECICGAVGDHFEDECPNPGAVRA